MARLMTFQNVIITSHQAFLTQEALINVAETTGHNLDLGKTASSPNEVASSVEPEKKWKIGTSPHESLTY